MKTITILCYGDSNTWGQVPLRDYIKSRYPRDIRWTGKLELLSSNQVRIIEEGNNGRTTGLEDPARPGRNGLSYLPACLDSTVPLDLVIFMLGTNDLKLKYQPDPQVITQRMNQLVKITKTICSSPPNQSVEILVISPPVIKPKFYSHGDFDYPEAENYAKSLAPLYERMCEQEDIHFIDSANYVEVSDNDGSHLDAENHALFAEALWGKVQSLPQFILTKINSVKSTNG